MDIPEIRSIIVSSCHLLLVRVKKYYDVLPRTNRTLTLVLIITVNQPVDKCNPSPCGMNAQCNQGQCTCFPEYFGDPYSVCRPECIINTDCPRDRSCIGHKCKDPCLGTCGNKAICQVVNHLPMCSCPRNMTGNAFLSCDTIRGMFLALFNDVWRLVQIYFYVQILLQPMHVILLRADQTVIVEQSIIKPCVLV